MIWEKNNVEHFGDVVCNLLDTFFPLLDLCLSASLQENEPTEFQEIFRMCRTWSIKFDIENKLEYFGAVAFDRLNP